MANESKEETTEPHKLTEMTVPLRASPISLRLCGSSCLPVMITNALKLL
jgi:hypothetical protein